MVFTLSGSRPHGKVKSLTVWRLDKQKYVDNDTCCSGIGASKNPGRWNGQDELLLYTASSIALAFLEIYVGIDPRNIQNDTYSPQIIQIYLDDLTYQEVTISELPNEWRVRQESTTEPSRMTLLQRIGSEWLSLAITPILKVPSAIIPNEFNYLLNPVHPDIKDRLSWKNPLNGQNKTGGVLVRVLPKPLEFDPRLIDLKDNQKEL
jgi:RES domain-containing protein